MGGGRPKNKAPMLSWYRNPQFRVSMQQREAPEPASNERGKTPPASVLPRDSQLALRPGTAPTTPSEKPQKVDKTRLRTVFDSCDTQQNGMVNKRELIKAIRGDARMAEFFGLPMEIRQDLRREAFG